MEEKSLETSQNISNIAKMVRLALKADKDELSLSLFPPPAGVNL
jgi:preprotein translocase subunit Sss1